MSKPPRAHASRSGDGRSSMGDESQHISSEFVGETEEQEEVQSPLKNKTENWGRLKEKVNLVKGCVVSWSCRILRPGNHRHGKGSQKDLDRILKHQT